tara:strand:+ start:834 stop:2183 length:1350 start_codon:yes stop_codon:yes gene_type:complete
MKSNILFVLVDGLRADQCYGLDKESHTPFLDSLINNGIYFNNGFSSADGTTISLNCLFNSKFQYNTGIRAQKIILLKDNHLQNLKNSNYYITGLIPKLTSLSPIREFFQNKNNTYEPGPPPETLSTGITEKILSLLDTLHDKSPWFCYLHLFDLHPLREGRLPLKIDEFKSEKFGKSTYAKTVSSIDYWLMQIAKKINFNDTILILTSDHGERIPYDNKSSFEFEPEFKNISSMGKKVLPKSTHQVGGKIMGKIKRTMGKTKTDYSNKKLTPYEKRSRDPYFTLSLYDELIHIPILINGLKLPSKNISEQVTNLDIFPTLFEILNIPYENSTEGRSLMPLIQNKEIDHKDIFLHTIPYEEESPLDSIGVRTGKYKYFRNSKELKNNVHLYNLEIDPYENNNISKDNFEIIQKMETKINNMRNKSDRVDTNITKEEEEEISKELKKLGYM